MQHIKKLVEKYNILCNTLKNVKICGTIDQFPKEPLMRIEKREVPTYMQEQWSTLADVELQNAPGWMDTNCPRVSRGG